MAFSNSFEGLNGVVHVEGLRDERLQIDSAGGDEIDGPLVHVGVTKDILNGCLTRLYLRDVDGDRVDGDSYKNGPVPGRTDLPQVIVGARMTGALEDDVGSPTRRMLTDDIEQSLILSVDAKSSGNAGGYLELGRGEVGDDDFGSTSRQR